MVLFTKPVVVEEALRFFHSGAGPWEFMDFLMMTESSLVKINTLIYWLREELNMHRKGEVAMKNEHKILTVWLILIGNIVLLYHKDSVQRKLTFFFWISMIVSRSKEQPTFHPEIYYIHKACSQQFSASLIFYHSTTQYFETLWMAYVQN